MSPFFDDLERQLHSAARTRVSAGATPAAPPPRRRRWLGAIPALAAVAVTLLVAGGALLLFGHTGRPSPAASPAGTSLGHIPPARLRREFLYIQRATDPVLRSRACHTASPPTGVSFIHGSPGPALLSTLGVLRRPVTAADHLGSQWLSGSSDVYAGSVRRALTARGVSYYVFAARQDLGAMSPSPHCFTLQDQAVHAYAPKIPSALRAQTLALEAALMRYARGLVAMAPQDVVCSVQISRNGGSSSGCGETLTQLRAGLQPSDDSGSFSAVVPDGVASVTLRFPAASGHPAITATARVRNNVYAVRVPQLANATQVQPTITMIWRAADGRILKTIVPQSRQAAAAYCRNQPIPCLAIEGATSTGGGSVLKSSSSASSTTTTAAASSGP
jgi:hypothetical protein